MARYNHPGHRPQAPAVQATGPLATAGLATQPDTSTFLGADAWTKNSKSDLYLRATSSFHGHEDDTHESADERDEKLKELTRILAIEDPVWVVEFAEYLRTEAHIRTAAIIIACEFVHARLRDRKVFLVEEPASRERGLSRRIIDVVCQRADEPGEILAYWRENISRTVPSCVKRGVGDAARRLYKEHSLLKWDTDSKAYRFGDVLEICHPRPKELVGVPLWEHRVVGDVQECPTPRKGKFPTAAAAPITGDKDGALLRSYLCVCGWHHVTKDLSRKPSPDDLEVRVERLFTAPSTKQGDLFKYAIDRRHGRGLQIPDSLGMLKANASFRATVGNAPYLVYDTDRLRKAGMTWEDAMSLGGQFHVDKHKIWEAMIPNMWLEALTKNLCNFDKTGVSDMVASQVIGKLTDPEQIKASRLFPFRFLSAYRATSETGSLRWAYALEQALNLSLSNVPALTGRTLVLVDRSPSMFPKYGWYTPTKSDERLGLPRADQAAIFGSALALRADNATLVEFGGQSRRMDVPRGSSVLKMVEKFGEISGTDIPSAIKQHYDGHDRVICITDEQTRRGYFPSNMRRYGGMDSTPMDALVPRNVPVFMWALGGYSQSAMPLGSNSRFLLGGLTDKAFAAIPMLESGASQSWPWQTGRG